MKLVIEFLKCFSKCLKQRSYIELNRYGVHITCAGSTVRNAMDSSLVCQSNIPPVVRSVVLGSIRGSGFIVTVDGGEIVPYL